MKLFLRKVLLYIVIPIVLCHVLFVMLYFILSEQVDNKLKNIAENSSVMIMGASAMTKVSPEYFDYNVYNIATPGEHYYFTFSKLQKLVANQNSKIELVLLGVSVHNFSPMFVNHFNLDAPEGQGSLRRYLLFLDLFDNEFITPFSIILNKEFFLGLILGPEWGGFKVSDNQDPSNLAIEGRVEEIFDRDFVDSLQYAPKQEYYLHKIVELCKSHTIDLVFVSTPVHSHFKNQVDQVYFEKLKNTIAKYPDLSYLNYLNDSIPGTYLEDPNHLNSIGSEIYSKKINSYLINNKQTPRSEIKVR